MARNNGRKLSLSQQQDLLNFLSTNAVPVVGNYSLGKTIGEGSFGKVKIGTHKMTGQQVAIKICDKIHAPTLVREIETWRQLRHPNIAQLYEVLCTESKIYMVMEYCKGGEVFEFIERNGRLDDGDEKCKRIFKQIVEAVGYCHEKNFVHRDLKLENILLTHHGDVKLIDFGFTRDYDDNKLLDTYCGSSAYAAPEIIGAKKYSGPEADIWSLGVILFTLVSGYLPFDDESDALVHKKIMQLDFHLPGFLKEDTKDLIMRFLKIDPAERISIADTLAHSWFTSCPGMSANDHGTAAMNTDPSVKSEEPLITGNNDEFILAAKMESLGFDVPAILESVNSNMCDQNAALWYLLLQQQREFTTTRRVSHSVIQTGRGSIASSTGSTCHDSISSSGPDVSSLRQTNSFSVPIDALSTEVAPFGNASLDPSTSISASESQHHSLASSGISPENPSTPSSGCSTTIQLTVDVEKYFLDVRRRSTSQSENPIINLASAVPSPTAVSNSNYNTVMVPSTISPAGYIAHSSQHHTANNSPNVTSSHSTNHPNNYSASPRGRRSIMMETMRANSETNRRTKNIVGRYGIGASNLPGQVTTPGSHSSSFVTTPSTPSSALSALSVNSPHRKPKPNMGMPPASHVRTPSGGELLSGPPIVEGEVMVFPSGVGRFHPGAPEISEEAENEDILMEL